MFKPVPKHSNLWLEYTQSKPFLFSLYLYLSVLSVFANLNNCVRFAKYTLIAPFSSSRWKGRT